MNSLQNKLEVSLEALRPRRTTPGRLSVCVLRRLRLGGLYVVLSQIVSASSLSLSILPTVVIIDVVLVVVGVGVFLVAATVAISWWLALKCL